MLRCSISPVHGHCLLDPVSLSAINHTLRGEPLKYEKRLIWLLGITFGILFFDRNAANFLMPFIAADLHFSNQQIGLIASALSFTWALGGLLGGAFSDRTGKRKPILIISVVAFCLCSFLSGLATSFVALFLSRLLMGLSEGPFLPVCHSLLAMESNDSERGNNMGIMQNFGSNLLGSFAAPLVLVALATAFNWRAAFFLAGLPGLVMAFLIARYVHEPKATAHTTTASADRLGFFAILRYRNMLVCVTMAIFMVSWMVLGWAFMPIFFMKVRQFSSGEMSILMSILGLSAAFFSFVVPRLSDRIGRRPVMVAFNLIGVLVPIVVCYFTGPVWLLGTLIFIGWSASGTFPIFMATIPSETMPARYIATAAGMVIGIGEVLGGVSGPAIAGWAADHYGLYAPMYLEGACALVGTVLALLLVETSPGRRSTATAAA